MTKEFVDAISNVYFQVGADDFLAKTEGKEPPSTQDVALKFMDVVIEHYAAEAQSGD